MIETDASRVHCSGGKEEYKKKKIKILSWKFITKYLSINRVLQIPKTSELFAFALVFEIHWLNAEKKAVTLRDLNHQLCTLFFPLSLLPKFFFYFSYFRANKRIVSCTELNSLLSTSFAITYIHTFTYILLSTNLKLFVYRTK